MRVEYGIIYDKMDFEERERQRRRQKIKVVIAELGMIFAIVAIVVVAMLSAMGFFVTSNGTIEQSGLMQLHSFPTGATVDLDGAKLFSKTNLSRTLPPGEHTIKLEKSGYDTWSKTIKMYSGMLIRLRYPRLFLLDRKQERVARLGEKLEFYTTSIDNSYILYAKEDDPIWRLVSVRGDDVRTTEIDMTKVLPGVKESGTKEKSQQFTGRVEQISWSENSDYVVVRVGVEEKTEWILVNLKDANRSLNLTHTFGMGFDAIKIIDGSASQLYALENQHLRKINTNDRTISRVLLSGVEDFVNYEANVIYVMVREDADKKDKVVGVYRDGEKAGTVIAKVEMDVRVKVALTKYFDEDYMAFVVNDMMTIYYGAVPSYREEAAETDFSGLKILVDQMQLMELPETLEVSPEGEYLVARSGKDFMVVDLDMGDLYEYEAGTDEVKWLDDSMMMNVVDDKLTVWDFDYTNLRVLVKTKKEYDSGVIQQPVLEKKSVTTKTNATVVNYPAIVSENSKWLYYVVRSNGELMLVREKIRD